MLIDTAERKQSENWISVPGLYKATSCDVLIWQSCAARIPLSVDFLGHLWILHAWLTLLLCHNETCHNYYHAVNMNWGSEWRGATDTCCSVCFFLFLLIHQNACTLWLIVHSLHTGTQISCFAPTNFSWRQAAYVDSFCWAAVQQQADSSPLWLHKVLMLPQHSLPGTLLMGCMRLRPNSRTYSAVKKCVHSSWFLY